MLVYLILLVTESLEMLIFLCTTPLSKMDCEVSKMVLLKV